MYVNLDNFEKEVIKYVLGSLCSLLGTMANTVGAQMGGDGSCPPAAPRLSSVRWRNQQPTLRGGASGKTEAASPGKMMSLMDDQNQNAPSTCALAFIQISCSWVTGSKMYIHAGITEQAVEIYLLPHAFLNQDGWLPPPPASFKPPTWCFTQILWRVVQVYASLTRWGKALALFPCGSPGSSTAVEVDGMEV